jgi:hypothetical protein
VVRHPVSLIDELRTGSEEFARLWDDHDVIARPAMCKTFDHPVVGQVAVNCDALDVADRDQRVVIYTGGARVAGRGGAAPASHRGHTTPGHTGLAAPGSR